MADFPTQASFPTQARVVIVGGGIVGCSVAYHLTKLGWTDVVVLEQGRLSSGTTWHAAGLVGQLRAHQNMTRLIRYSTELYASLAAETGLETGWKRCGSVVVARSQDRLTILKRNAALAQAFGVECEIISPQRAGELYPIMRTDDLAGAVWLPGDGKANPADLTQSLAKGARLRGAKIFEKTRVLSVTTRDDRATGVVTDRGPIAAEVVVNCAGQWARQFGRMAGVTVPLYSCEHMYIVTKKVEGVFPDLPCLRDPDGYVYFKEEVGGLLMGGFEPVAKPWDKDIIPDDFEFQLLPDDWDQFDILMQNALIRVPGLEKAEVRQFVNGPESFTADNNYILGEAPELKNFFVGAGFNSMGIASAGGAGMALAEWIVNGEPTLDLWPVDIRRFARFNGQDAWLKDRVSEVLGLHYQMPWPNREFETARPLRRSPLYDRLKARRAAFGNKMGWERPNWFAPEGVAPVIEYSFGRQNWFPHVAAEHKATREGAALFDLTSFSKLLLQGRDAEAVMQRLCAADAAVAPGRIVYTPLLNERGTFESDLTFQRLSADEYFLVTGTAQTTRDLDWIRRNIPEQARCTVTDMTSSHAVLALMGPKAREVLAKVTKADLSNEAFPFSTFREIGIGYAPVRAARITYVGELGWELYVPTEFAAGVYDLLAEAGAVDAGYYAIDSLRLEKAYRAWGRDVTPDHTPYEAGLGFAVALDKAVPFLGQDVLRRQKAEGIRKRLVTFTFADPACLPHGGELILRDGKPVGETTSGGYGHTLGCGIAMGYVRADQPITRDWLIAGRYEINLNGRIEAVAAHLAAPYDPKGLRVRA